MVLAGFRMERRQVRAALHCIILYNHVTPVTYSIEPVYYGSVPILLDNLSQYFDLIKRAVKNRNEQLPPPMPNNPGNFQCNPTNGPPGPGGQGGGGGGTAGKAEDPNYIIGPAGFGACENFVSNTESSFPYQIGFENEPTGRYSPHKRSQLLSSWTRISTGSRSGWGASASAGRRTPCPRTRLSTRRKSTSRRPWATTLT